MISWTKEHYAIWCDWILFQILDMQIVAIATSMKAQNVRNLQEEELFAYSWDYNIEIGRRFQCQKIQL